MSHYLISQVWRKEQSESHSQKTPQSINRTQNSMNVNVDIPPTNVQIKGHVGADNDMQILSWMKSVLTRRPTLGCQRCCRLESNHSHQEDEQGQLPQCQEEEGVEGPCLQEGVGEEGVCCHRHPCPPLLQQQIELIQINCSTHIACHRMIVPSLAGRQTNLTQRQACFRKTQICNFQHKSHMQLSRQQAEEPLHDATHCDEQNFSGRDSRHAVSP